MRRFLQRFLEFTLLIVLMAVLADMCVSRGLQKTERGHFYTMNALMNKRMDADVVVLGNSRAACSYHPQVLDSVLHINSRNLGVSGQPFEVSWLRWALYRRNNQPPKLLIVNIDYSELGIVTNGFEKEQYYPYVADTLVKPFLDLYGFSWMEKHLPMYRYRGDYKLISVGIMELLGIRHDTKGGFIKGYSNSNEKWNGINLESVLQAGIVKGKCESRTVKLLESILEQSQREDFQVVFVYAPVFKRLKLHLEEEESLQAYHDLSHRFNVPILDYSQMRICSDTSYFKDANHLNSRGAELFSLSLAHSIDSLGILR